MNVVVAVGVALIPAALAAVLFWRLARTIRVEKRHIAMVGVAGFAFGLLATHVEAFVFRLTGLALDAPTVGTGGALLAMFLFAAPFEEALKVLPVWPLYSTHRLDSRRLGLGFAATSAAGFASAESIMLLSGSPLTVLLTVRVLLAVFAHLFCAGIWGYALGSRGRARWFSLAWLVATATHGIYDHVVFGQGAAFLVGVLPLLGAMALLLWLALRDIAPVSGATSRRGLLSSTFPEPPSLRAMQRALGKTDRPVMFHWIGIGALVTIGVVLVALAIAVYTGHRLGIDFAIVDDADVRAGGPLILLGSAVLAAFPFAGYLVARASAAQSVLEPAMGAAVAIAAVVAMLSLTSPVALVFALATAPVAFGLACGGAWFGMGR